MHKRAVGIIIKNNKILLIHRYNTAWQKDWYYVFPGGGVEEGETTEEAVIREIKEELSVNAKLNKLLFVEHNPRKVHNFEGRDEYFYLITEFSGEIQLGGPEKERMNENDQFVLEWIPLSKIKQMKNLFPVKAKEKLIKILGLQI